MSEAKTMDPTISRRAVLVAQLQPFARAMDRVMPQTQAKTAMVMSSAIDLVLSLG
jgi:hypothetical protein